MSSQMIRHEGNRTTGMRDLDLDGDGVIDVGTGSKNPIYAIDMGSRSSVITWYKAGFKLLWRYPFVFIGIGLFIRFVIVPIAFVAPVALLRNNPTTLTNKQAGGELEAMTNNLVVNTREIVGSTLDNTQKRQVKENEAKSDRATGSDLLPKAKVVFVEN